MASFKLCTCGMHGKFEIAGSLSDEFPACRPVLFKEVDRLKAVGDISHLEAAALKAQIAVDSHIAETESDYVIQIVQVLRKTPAQVSGKQVHLIITFTQGTLFNPETKQKMSDELLTELARHPMAKA